MRYCPLCELLSFVIIDGVIITSIGGIWDKTDDFNKIGLLVGASLLNLMTLISLMFFRKEINKLLFKFEIFAECYYVIFQGVVLIFEFKNINTQVLIYVSGMYLCNITCSCFRIIFYIRRRHLELEGQLSDEMEAMLGFP